VCTAHEGVKVGDGLAGEVVRLGEHQIGAGCAIELTEAEDLLGLDTPAATRKPIEQGIKFMP
jgi:hypothetical protein